jgi:hypothetical protein
MTANPERGAQSGVCRACAAGADEEESGAHHVLALKSRMTHTTQHNIPDGRQDDASHHLELKRSSDPRTQNTPKGTVIMRDTWT